MSSKEGFYLVEKNAHDVYLDNFKKVEGMLDRLQIKYPDSQEITDTYKALIDMFFYTSDVYMAFEGKKAENRQIYKLWHDARFDFEALKFKINNNQ